HATYVNGLVNSRRLGNRSGHLRGSDEVSSSSQAISKARAFRRFIRCRLQVVKALENRNVMLAVFGTMPLLAGRR
ncbi:MAG: hypothetical protein WAV20_25575, partial [Blastocatellia bacterium]